MTEPPRRMREVLAQISCDPSMNDGLSALTKRSGEFRSTLAAKLAGVALNPLARARLDEELDAMWANAALPSKYDEVVVGAGLHAAIYCAVRVRQGHPKPLVLEGSDRVGGVFAASTLPSFYLNSRNRPGPLGLPGRDESLNYLPGAIVQPADLGVDEYQVNTDLAYAIRSTLAMCGRVVTGVRVNQDPDANGVETLDGRVIPARRVIWSTGLGDPVRPNEADGKCLMDYLEFLRHLDKPFPFKDVRSVAVVGAGDSGRTTIEALVGQGPASRWTIASLDWVEKIDWFGVPETCLTREDWMRSNRSRYKGIARVLPRRAGEASRVRPIKRQAGSFGTGYEGAYVDGVRYDLVVVAGGFAQGRTYEQQDQYSVGGRVVARRIQKQEIEQEMFVIGPAANLDVGGEETQLKEVPENIASVWRYADRTAALAMSLEGFDGKRKALPKLSKKLAKAIAAGNKNDPRNWEPGDLIAFSGGSKTAVVRTVEQPRRGGFPPRVTIERESNGGQDGRGISTGLWNYAG